MLSCVLSTSVLFTRSCKCCERFWIVFLFLTLIIIRKFEICYNNVIFSTKWEFFHNDYVRTLFTPLTLSFPAERGAVHSKGLLAVRPAWWQTQCNTPALVRSSTRCNEPAPAAEQPQPADEAAASNKRNLRWLFSHIKGVMTYVSFIFP